MINKKSSILEKINKKLEFHWKIIVSIVIPISIMIIISTVIASYFIESTIIEEAKKIRLKNDYEWAYLSLIKGHESISLSDYKVFKQEFFKKFSNVRIIRTTQIDQLFGKEREEFYPLDEIEKSVLTDNKESVRLEGKSLRGIFPIKAEVSCITCHYNVKEKEVIGAISIVVPLQETLLGITKAQLFFVLNGIVGLILTILLVYIIYIKIGYNPIISISSVLNKVAEGDLTISIDKKLLSREDIIGKLIQSIKKTIDYLNNFSARILNYSLKLVYQVDESFKMVEKANEMFKVQNLKLAQASVIVDDFTLSVGEISRNTNSIITLTKDVSSKLEEIKVELQNPKNVNLEELLNKVEQIRDNAINIATNIEKSLKSSEVINSNFEEIIKFSNDISQFIEKINEHSYETLIISTYMKTIASTLRSEKTEELLFDMFEKDIDRYLLRIYAHVKDIDKLDPERWGDYTSFPIGKWFYSEEAEKIREEISDFDFAEFGKTYKTLHDLGKEIIIAHNREDSLKVDKLLQQLANTSKKLKLYLAELKDRYLELREKSRI